MVGICITENQWMENNVEILVISIELGKPIIQLIKKENRKTDDGLY